MAYQAPCPAPVTCPPTVVYKDQAVPVPVPVVHPIEVVNRLYYVPVPQHYYTYTVRQEVCGVSGRSKKRRK